MVERRLADLGRRVRRKRDRRHQRTHGRHRRDGDRRRRSGPGCRDRRRPVIDPELSCGDLVRFATRRCVPGGLWLVAFPDALQRPDVQAFRNWLLDELQVRSAIRANWMIPFCLPTGHRQRTADIRPSPLARQQATSRSRIRVFGGATKGVCRHGIQIAPAQRCATIRGRGPAAQFQAGRGRTASHPERHQSWRPDPRGMAGHAACSCAASAASRSPRPASGSFAQCRRRSPAFASPRKKCRAGGPPGSLSVSIPTTFASRWLLPRLTRFRERYPDIVIALHTEFRQYDTSLTGTDLGIRMAAGSPGGRNVAKARPRNLRPGLCTRTSRPVRRQFHGATVSASASGGSHLRA